MGWFRGFLDTSDLKESDPEFSAAIARVENSLNDVPPSEARFLACLALLMARIAYIDSQVSEGEKLKIREVLCNQLQLSASLADRVTSIVVETVLSRSIDHHLVLRRLNEISSRERKFQVIRTLFHIARDEDISEAESEDIGSIANALHVTRSEFISLRSEFRDHLSVLKDISKK